LHKFSNLGCKITKKIVTLQTFFYKKNSTTTLHYMMLHNLTFLSTQLSDLQKGQLFVLTDTNSAKYCLPILSQFIGKIPYHLLTIEPGEKSKNLESVQVVWDFLLKYRATREAILINLGGGMITDLGGFAAATYMRGIRFINIPTTLLAMVDASSGGKTGIDYQGVKNIIGTFTAPLTTLIHPDFLFKLPTTELFSGFAEMLKHALIASKEEWIKLLQLALSELSHQQFIEALSSTNALQTSITIKEKVVTQDPNEIGLRKILNFGHTIGHGFESAAHGRYLHGECVALGMLYMSSEEVQEQLCAIYENLGFELPEFYSFNLEEVKEAITHDKKASNQGCSVVFVSEIGNGSIEEWTMDQVLERLEC
jgi:3-dehydroquinate synthase